MLIYKVKTRILTPKTTVFDVHLNGFFVCSNGNKQSAINFVSIMNKQGIYTLKQWKELIPYNIRLQFIISFNQSYPNFKGEKPC